MRLGEKVELCRNSGSRVCGCDTGRVIAMFSHEAEAESFIELINGINDYHPDEGERVLAYHADWGFEVSMIDKSGGIPIGLTEAKATSWFELPDHTILPR